MLLKDQLCCLTLGLLLKLQISRLLRLDRGLFFMPKSACRNTSIASSTTTPGTLLSFPKIMLNAVTTKKQNATTKYTLKL